MKITAAFLVWVVASLGGSGVVAEPAEVELTTSSQGAVLKGAWLAPATPAVSAPVVIIPGSGPTDRNGDNPLGVRARSYALLAKGLAARGVPTLRVDKRGMFSSAAPGLDPNAVTIAIYAEDARAWASEAAGRAGAPCAWLLGHSEGALVALAAAQDADAPICGVLSVAGPGRKPGQVLREQLRANPANGPILAQAEAAIAEVEAGRPVDAAALHPGLQPLFAAPVQPFLRSLLALDPADLARNLKKPLLILQGETDLQTARADAEALKTARPDATLLVLPGVNHVLKRAPADRAANLAAYADPALPIAEEVVDAVTRFVTDKGPLPAR
jgi:pimeloyl-ACP methyl ester carboxylesterase